MLEVVSERGKFHKSYAIDPNNEHIRQVNIYSQPVHFINEEGVFDEIDTTLNLTTSQKGYTQYLTYKADFSCGFRNDLQTHKFFGLRHGNINQYEVTLVSLVLGDESIPIPERFSSINKIGPSTIEHIILPDVSIYSEYKNTEKLVSAVKTTRWVTNFSMEEEIHLKGFVCINDVVGNLFIPDDYGRFIFIDPHYKDYALVIPPPMMWNDDGKVSYGIEHSLKIVNDKFTYSKKATEEGKDWFLLNRPPFYIDSTTKNYNTHEDGFIYSNTNWNETNTANLTMDKTSASINLGSFYIKGYALYRGFLTFNTANLPINTIQSANLKIKTTSSNTASYNVYVYNGSHSVPLVVGDFTKKTSTNLLSASYFTLAAKDTLYTIPYSSSALSTINKMGYTKVVLRDYNDIANQLPAGIATGFIYSAESSYPPVLEITGTTTNVSLKVGGAWKEGDLYIKVSGVWKPATTVYTKVGGIWKS